MRTPFHVTAFIGVSLGLLTVCITCKNSVSPLTFEPNPENTIPSHFVTYVSDDGFSVSYPPDWETDTLFTKQAKTFTERWYEANSTKISVEHVRIALIAGKPVDTGYHPNVTIVSEPLAGNIDTIEDMVEAEVQSIKAIIDGYEECSRVKTIVDGKEAAVIEYQGMLQGIGQIHNLTLFMIYDDIIWSVNCTSATSLTEFSEYYNDFYSIIRSFRILK